MGLYNIVYTEKTIKCIFLKTEKQAVFCEYTCAGEI